MHEQDPLEIEPKPITHYAVFNTLPHWLIGLLVYSKGVYLAGGACRAALDNTLVQDYDLFFEDPESKKHVEKWLGEEYEIFRCPEDKLVTYRKYGVKIQLCSPRYYSTAEELVHSFDITASCISIHCDRELSWKVTYLPDTLRDIANKRIRLNTVQYPVATINRIQKYRAKGYTITDEVWKDLLTRVRHFSQEDFDNPDNMAMYID